MIGSKQKPATIRVLLIDDHTIFRAGLRMLLESTDDLEVVAEAEGRTSGLAAIKSEQPDIVLLDLRSWK